MVTCTTPPFRAAVRLNSGVRGHDDTPILEEEMARVLGGIRPLGHFGLCHRRPCLMANVAMAYHGHCVVGCPVLDTLYSVQSSHPRFNWSRDNQAVQANQLLSILRRASR